jgi:hypothetical protein
LPSLEILHIRDILDRRAMKHRLILALAIALLGSAATSEAGWGGCGWGGGWGGWYGPSFGVSFVAPIPIYRPVYYTPAPVYYATPAPVAYVRTVRYTRPVAVVNRTLARAQSQLSSLGYYAGVVDGSFGPLTSRAITQYQADYGLPVTGRLDRATLKSLGV